MSTNIIEHSDPAVSDSEEAFDNMLEHFTPTNNRYGVVKINYTKDDGRPAEDVVCIYWRGANTKTKAKMKYAGSVAKLRNAFSFKLYGEFEDKESLTHDHIVSLLRKK